MALVTAEALTPCEAAGDKLPAEEGEAGALGCAVSVACEGLGGALGCAVNVA